MFEEVKGGDAMVHVWSSGMPHRMISQGASEQIVHLLHDWAMEAHTCMEYIVRVHSMPSNTAGHVPEVHVHVRVPLTDVHTCTLYNIHTHKSGYNLVIQ